MILGIAGGLLAICIVIVSALIIRSRQRKLKPPPLGSFDDTKPAVAFPQNRPAASSLQRGKAYDDNSPSLVSIHVETSPAASWTGHELENAMTVASGGQLAPAPPAVVIASTLSRYSQQSQQSSRNMPGPVEEEESDDEEPTAADVVKVVLQNEGVVSEAGALPPGYDKVVGSLHKVVLEYTPTFEDELYLNIDDEVVLNHLFEDGWGRGTNLTTGKNGVFPVMCISEKALSDKVLTENHISRADQAETAIMRKPTISSDKLPKRSTSLSKPEFSI
ncbi:hypothetical protein BC829DRAFT_387431 [Chytridium lagenaria]|nr:hypothetical protein BC829DRAFT_387431 [Chytridium lagenaria]